MASKLYVGFLPFTTTDSDLEELFSPYGALVSVTVLMEREDPTRSRGFGFVEFENESDAQEAQAALNGRVLDAEKFDRGIKVDKAQERQKSPRY